MIIDIVPAIKTFMLGLNQIHYAMGQVSKNWFYKIISQLIKESQVMIRQEYISSCKMGLLILSNVQYEKLFENNYI
jgi:hypothetical protein